MSSLTVLFLQTEANSPPATSSMSIFPELKDFPSAISTARHALLK